MLATQRLALPSAVQPRTSLAAPRRSSLCVAARAQSAGQGWKAAAGGAAALLSAALLVAPPAVSHRHASRRRLI